MSLFVNIAAMQCDCVWLQSFHVVTSWTAATPGCQCYDISHVITRPSRNDAAAAAAVDGDDTAEASDAHL